MSDRGVYIFRLYGTIMRLTTWRTGGSLAFMRKSGPVFCGQVILGAPPPSPQVLAGHCFFLRRGVTKSSQGKKLNLLSHPKLASFSPKRTRTIWKKLNHRRPILWSPLQQSWAFILPCEKIFDITWLPERFLNVQTELSNQRTTRAWGAQFGLALHWRHRFSFRWSIQRLGSPSPGIPRPLS